MCSRLGTRKTYLIMLLIIVKNEKLYKTILYYIIKPKTEKSLNCFQHSKLKLIRVCVSMHETIITAM